MLPGSTIHHSFSHPQGVNPRLLETLGRKQFEKKVLMGMLLWIELPSVDIPANCSVTFFKKQVQRFLKVQHHECK